MTVVLVGMIHRREEREECADVEEAKIRVLQWLPQWLFGEGYGWPLRIESADSGVVLMDEDALKSFIDENWHPESWDHPDEYL